MTSAKAVFTYIIQNHGEILANMLNELNNYTVCMTKNVYAPKLFLECIQYSLYLLSCERNT